MNRTSFLRRSVQCGLLLVLAAGLLACTAQLAAQARS
jgi:hypothetical protein